MKGFESSQTLESKPQKIPPNLQNQGLNVPYLEEEEDVDAVLMVHHDYEGALLGVKQVSDGIVRNGDNLKKLVPFYLIMTYP